MESESGTYQPSSEGLSGAKDTAKEQAQQAKDTVKEQAQQVASVSDAMRSMGEQLRSQGSDMPAQLVHQVANQTEQLGRYLRDSDADRILRDVEDFGRRQPWVVAAAGLALGVAAARFLKASSKRRYEQSTYGGGTYAREPYR